MRRKPILYILIGSIVVANFSTSLVQAVDLSRKSKSDRSLTELGFLLAEIGKKEDAIIFFDRAIALAAAIEEREEKIATMTYIADRLASSGFRDRAEVLFDRAVAFSQQKTDDFYSHYYEDGTLKKVAIQMAKSGFRDRALAQIDNIRSPLARAEVLNAVAAAFIHENEFDRGRELLLEAVKVAKTETEYLSYEANGSCENSEYALFVKIADNFSKISQLKSALDLAESVRSCYSASNLGFPFQQYQVDAFLAIIDNLATVEMLRETWRSAQGIADDFETLAVWVAIANKLVQIEEYDFAMSIARRLTNSTRFKVDEMGIGGEYFSEYRQFSLSSIAFSFVEKGKFVQAQNILQLLSEPLLVEISVMIEIEIAQKEHQQGNTESAIQRLLGLSSRYAEDASILSDEDLNITEIQTNIALRLAQIGAEEKAVNTIQRLAESSSEGLILVELSRIFATLGGIADALQILSQFDEESQFLLDDTLIKIVATMTELEHLEEALKLTDDRQPSRDTVRGKIGLQFLKLGELERGYHLINSIQGRYANFEILAEAGLQLIRQGETEKALNAIEKIEVPAIAARTFADVAWKVAIAQ